MCCQTGWKLVFAGSRFTTETESRYAPIEGEALAVCYALAKCRMFIVGCPNLIIVTDHKPLVKILGDKSLENIANPRLFNLKEKTVQYQFIIKHVDGKGNCSADACSRSPSTEIATLYHEQQLYDCLRDEPTEEEKRSSADMNNQIEATIIGVMTSPDDGNISAISIQRIKTATSNDKCINNLIQYITSGFPTTKKRLRSHLHRFWNVRNELSVLDGLALYGHRVIIPSSLHSEVLEILHSAHQGITE